MIDPIYNKSTVMEKFKNVIEFENAITKNKRIIAKKKKSVPYILICIIMLYMILFNFNGAAIDVFFNNYLEFIKTLTFGFVLIICTYGMFIYFSIYKLNNQAKEWNKSLYNLAKLDETVLYSQHDSL